VGFTDADLRFLARAVAGDDLHAAQGLLRAWGDDPEQIETHLDDERVLRRLAADERLVIELSPRFLFTVLLARIRRDLAEIPYTVERVESDGRVVVFDAGRSVELLHSRAIFGYLVELLVSFERSEVMTIGRPGPARPRRLSTMSIGDMVELAGLVEPPLRPMVFRRIGDIALFTTGLFPDAVLRERRPPLGAETPTVPSRHRLRLEDYEAEGRRFYRLAADRLTDSHPGLAGVLVRLAEQFTAARKPLNVLGERYIAWARPRWHPPA
jgi:hypothetical protein